ncbi:HD domain-containing protein [bacterium]|nr:MAG: HD domain-containing protein [bacterium]
MIDVEVGLDKLLFSLNTLSELADVTVSGNNFYRIIKSSLYMVMGSFPASKGAIFGYDPAKKAYTPIVAKGLGDINDINIHLEEAAIRGFAIYNRPLDLTSNDPAVAMLGPARDMLERLGARLMVFLVVKDEVLGFITINGKFTDDLYTPYDIRVLHVMAQHIAFSLHTHSLLAKLLHKYTENKELYDNMRRIYYDTIHAFATAIDAKDSYTKGHSHRVSAYCTAMSREMHQTLEETEGIRIAGLMHDIGKLAIDKTIINKNSSLTKNEFIELVSHPVVGYEILSKVKFPWKGLPMMTRSHHEKFDGSGYPDGLKSTAISAGARIMALADAFDAMTTDRPYRKKLSFIQAMNELKKCCGTQFDPEVVHSFVSVIRKEVSGKTGDLVILPMLGEELGGSSGIQEYLNTFELPAA